MNMIQVSWIQVSYAMSIVGVQKGYGKIRWLDMLGHRIFPGHFWFLLIIAEFLSYQLFRCPSVQVCPKSCPDTASALLHEARKIRLKQVVWPYDYTDSICAAQAHGCDAQVQCNAMKCHAMQCNAVKCNAMQCNVMRCNVMQCNAMQCKAM